MLSRRLLFACLLPLVAACHWVEGDGHLVDEARDVPAFDRVHVGSGLRVAVTTGEPSVVLHLDRNLLDWVETWVAGGELYVMASRGVSLDPSAGAEVRVRLPVARGLYLSGGAEGTAALAPVEALDLSLSGGSRLTARGLSVGWLGVDASGGSALDLSGAAEQVSLSLSGGSRVDEAPGAFDLQVDLSGGSRAHASATRSARGTLSGGSTLWLAGSPAQRDLQVSGGSQVFGP